MNLTESLRAMSLLIPALCASVPMDSQKLHADILAHLSSNPVAQKHIRITSNIRWMQSNNGFLQHDNQIYVPEAGNLWLQVLQYKHNHVLLGHFSQNKTLSLICHKYTWPGIQTFINDFCKSCITCMHSKSQHHKPYGFLKQLPVSEHPWNSISMGFIKKFPRSSGYTAILMVFNRLTKQAIFILTHDTITSAELTKLFVLHVFSKQSHVTSNQGS